MTGWELLPRIVLLLTAAVVAGLLARRLRQNVIVGYLLAGLLLGPTGIGLVRPGEDVNILSELGVALLLFSIGLEFSFKRLRQLGRVAVGGGTLQIAGTIFAVSTIASLAGLSLPSAITLGMAFAMSSTAVVLRELTDRAELDSAHGRNAVGILLLQDVAVIPILIITDALGQGLESADIVAQFGARSSLVIVFFIAAWTIARFLLPRVLSAAALSGSRDLSVVVAVCVSVGAAWGAHSLEFSPSLGAFAAGIVLAESPFATQIRADVTPLGAVFVTLFFASVGTNVALPLDPAYFGVVLVIATVVMAGKALIAGTAVWVFQRSLRTALVTGIAVSQVGEFTFVIAGTGNRTGLLSAEIFQLALAVSLVTLILTPFALQWAPLLAARLLRAVPVRSRGALEILRASGRWERVLVIGYGPAGQQVVSRLTENGIPFLVLETNPATVASHRTDLPIELGDATMPEVLSHAGAGASLAVVVTIPDPGTSRLIIAAVRRVAPAVPVMARARYHIHADSLRESGARYVVDEEQLVGLELGEQAVSVVLKDAVR